MKKIGLRICCAAICVAGFVQARPPNIVLILADDLGYGDLSCYNAENPIPTPNLDRMAEEGRLFTQAFAPCSVCSPTRYSIMTGQYPWRGPLKTGVVLEYESSLIDPALITLPERLRAAGYRTAAVGKWHLGMDWPTVDGKSLLSKFGRRPTFEQFKLLADEIDYAGRIGGGPVDHGFDTYYGEDIVNYPPYMFIENDRFAAQPARLRDDKNELSGQPGMMEADWRDDTVLSRQVDKVLDWIDQRADEKGGKPFFLYWGATAVHYPIRPSKAFVSKTRFGAYGDFVFELDDGVGRVVQKLRERGLDSDTLVIFASDNGPLPYSIPGGHVCAGGLRGIKTTGWDGGLKVPFIVRWPQKIPAHSRSDAMISLVDLYPSLCALAETGCEDQFKDGRDILNTFRDGTGSEPRAIVTTSTKGCFGIRRGEWTYLDYSGSGSRKMADQKTAAQQLYMHSDPGQTNNLVSEYPEKALELKRELERIKGLYGHVRK
jgi:arylsulfatase A-like enzyme